MILIDFIKKIFSGIYECSFHKLTGYYCPGCGGTRAVILFTKGKFITSATYNPLPDYVALVVLLFVSMYIYSFIRKSKRPGKQFIIRAVYLGLFIVFINFIVKNYYLVFKGIDLLKPL